MTQQTFGALREMRRVLAPRGCLHIVFSLHEEQELRKLMNPAGFHEVDVQTTRTTLRLPPAKEFLWQYVFSTPLANVVAKASDDNRGAIEGGSATSGGPSPLTER